MHQMNMMQNFNEYIDSIAHKLKIELYETPLFEYPSVIFDNFIYSHFTDEGCDLIFWWMYEDVPKIIYQDTIFGKVETNIEDIEDLWKYLISNKEIYFK